MTYDEWLVIKEQCAYLLNAMESISKNGDAYCAEDELFRACTRESRSLTFNRFRADKVKLVQTGCLHQEAVSLAMQRTLRPRRSKLVAKTNMLRYRRSA